MARMEFRKWLLSEARAEPVPDMVGFVLRYNTAVRGHRSEAVDALPGDSTLPNGTHETKPFQTMAEVYAAKREMWERHQIISSIHTRFRDGTVRPLGQIFGDVAWHYNRAGRTVNDYQVDRSGRGKTNQAYLAAKHATHQFYVTLNTLVHELRPGNMPMNSGEETPDGWWEMLNSALECCMREHQITPLAMFYDRAFEEYGEYLTQPAVKCCLRIIHRGLEILGMKQPLDAALKYDGD